MPIKLSPPVIEKLPLEKSDKAFNNEGDPTTVTIKQATEEENILRQNLLSLYKRTLEMDGTISINSNISPAVLRRYEIFLTLTDTNLQGEKGKPLFTFPLKEDEFNTAYGMLHPQIVEEIHEQVKKVNPTWSNILE